MCAFLHELHRWQRSPALSQARAVPSGSSSTVRKGERRNRKDTKTQREENGIENECTLCPSPSCSPFVSSCLRGSSLSRSQSDGRGLCSSAGPAAACNAEQAKTAHS